MNVGLHDQDQLLASRVHKRGRFDGAWSVARFNWQAYLAVALLLLLAMVSRSIAMPFPLEVALWIAFVAGGFWTVSSVVVSHWVYDRSPLYRWNWLVGIMAFRPRAWANVHAGFDESTPALRRLFPDARGTTVDCFDPVEMTEPSIARARQSASPDSNVLRSTEGRLPLPDGAVDTVFLILAAHEIRRPAGRHRFFRELHRVLRPGGQILLVEHLRDFANFVAYGPGCLHFHSCRTWLASAGNDFDLFAEQRLTPFLRVFVFRRRP